MPATFIALSRTDIFKSGGAGQNILTVPMVDNLIGPDGLAIYNSVSVQVGETLQYFLTFDDVIKFIHFGKGLGNVTAEGIMYCDCNGNIPGAQRFAQVVSGLRGKTQSISVGSVVVTATMTTSQLTMSSDPDTMAHFVFNFAVVNHLM